MEDIAGYLLTRSQEYLVENENVVTGFLLRSGNINRVGPGRWELEYSAPYAEDIEFGTEPHEVDIVDLQRWAKRKFSLDENEAMKVATAVQKKIKEEGSNPYPFVRAAIEDLKNVIAQDRLEEASKEAKD